MRLGEADRIVTLITPGHGKVRAVAKGVRRTKSRFGGRLEPLSHVSVLCWQGRELDVVTQAEVLDSFRAVREDLDRVGRATAMLEAVDQVSQERHGAPRLYEMLVGALRVMSGRDSALVVPAFFLKLLELEGCGPVLDSCAACGSGGPLVAFDLGMGGALCRSCRTGAAISPGALSLARRVLGGDLAGALAEPRGATTEELDRLATSALEVHLERRLRSVRSLPTLGTA
jgi:DNA repair protein RecO (recombination protein O)